MLLGVVIHGLLSFMPIPLPGAPQDVNQNPEVYGYVFNFIHGFRMQLFFLVSGFFTAMLWRDRGLGELLKHRAKRILLPLVISLPILWVSMIGLLWANGVDFSPEATQNATGESFKTFESQATRILGVPLFIGFMAPIMVHLWFLYYLVWMILGFAFIAWLVNKFNLKPVPAWMVRSPWLWLPALTLLPQATNGLAGIMMGLPIIGPDTFGGVLPWPPQLIYYGIFFAFGALCYGREEFETHIGKRWRLYFALALPAMLAGMHWVELRNAAYNAGWETNREEIIRHHVISSVFQMLYAWLMIFGCIGFFRRWFSGENAKVRYASDASYWIYIAHMPLIMALQYWVSQWSWPSFVKFLFVCGLTVGILVLIYVYAIRYTWVGTLLNGKRTRAPEQP